MLDLVSRKAEKQEALSCRGHLCLVAGVGGCDFLELLAARRPELHKLLRAREFLMIGLEHRLHRQVFHLRLGEI